MLFRKLFIVSFFGVCLLSYQWGVAQESTGQNKTPEMMSVLNAADMQARMDKMNLQMEDMMKMMKDMHGNMGNMMANGQCIGMNGSMNGSMNGKSMNRKPPKKVAAPEVIK